MTRSPMTDLAAHAARLTTISAVKLFLLMHRAEVGLNYRGPVPIILVPEVLFPWSPSRKDSMIA